MITGDTREKARDLVEAALFFAGAGHEFTTTALPFGDWQITDQCDPPHSLPIERKKAEDLLASLGKPQANGEPRLKNQLAKAPECRLVVIQGSIERALEASRKRAERRGSKRYWRRSSVYGIMLHYIRQGVPFVHVETTLALFDLLRVWDNVASRTCILDLVRQVRAVPNQEGT